MAINFPSGPTVGQTISSEGTTYIWDGVSWDISGGITAGNIPFTTSTVSAAGTTQGTATAITTDLVLINSVAVGSGIILPLVSLGRRMVIRNSGLNDLKVYPATGAQINDLGANVAFTLPFSTTLEFAGYTSTQWYTLNATFA